eukprot:TRINITY_DN5264_c0_g1_i1.p1 TRINITY_DN5264_c0_g1~~TRINITY_DN5264_c0_g1_i1.p1  ORF type:complete len:2741 (+),score=986.98 TRINITY_DN5264_c0_g1_i1:951-8225(+)
MADPEDEYMAEADGDVSAAASTHPTAAASTHPTAAAPAAPLKKGGGYSLRHELVSIPLATQKHVRELQSQPDDALLAGVKGDGEASGAGSKGDVSADTKTGSSGSGGKQSAETGVSTTPPSSTPGAASPGRGKATPRTDPNRGRAWFSTQEADVDFTPQVPLEGGGADGDLEVDTINRSPVMPTLLRLLIFLKELAGEDTTSHAPPGWMSELLGAITTAAALNVRVFIAKVVVNAPKLFERFAGLWVAPLIDVALETMQPGQLGVSYFLRDVATTVISWGEDVRTAGFDAEARVSRLLAVLLKACTDKKKAILQANLELVKMLIRQWKERVRINAEHKHIMLGWIAYPETDANYVRARVAGLQLLGVLLANGLPAYDKAVDVGVVTEGGFYDRVLAGLPPHPQQQVIPKELIDTAAEVVGLIMQQQSVKDAPSPTLYDKVMRKLRALHGNSQVENFLLFLGGVMKHYPPLVDEFLPLRILRFIPHAKGPYQPLILEIIDKRVQLFPTAYSELHPFVPDLLTGGSSDVQLLVFDIIGKALASGTPKDVHHYVTALSQDIKHKLMPLGALSLDARAALYDSWVKVFDARWDELSEEGKHVLTRHLLGGLQDGSTYIRDRMLRFWDDPSRLPPSLYRRLERLFVGSKSDLTLYSPSLGDQWVQYASILLLFLAHRSPDFRDRTAMFRDPLLECEYREMPVVTAHHAWSSTGGTFGVASIADGVVGPSLSQDGLGYGYGMGSVAGARAEPAVPGGVLATLAGTQAPSTPASLVATNFAHYEPRRFGGGGGGNLSQTSLLFQPFQQDGAMPPPPPPGVAGSQHMPGSLSPGGGGGYNSLGGVTLSTGYSSKLRRRFRRVTGEQKVSISALHATQTLRDRMSRHQTRLRHAASNVRMWRVYREGEVPDIQISLSSLLLPLEALCLYDVEVAQLALGELFQQSYAGLAVPGSLDHPADVPSTLFNQGTMEQPTRDGMHDILGHLVAVSAAGSVDRARLRELLGASLGTMLADMQAHGGVVTLLHSLMLGSDGVAEAAEPMVIYHSALASNNLRTGVLLLEKGIIARGAKVDELAKEVWKRGGAAAGGAGSGSGSVSTGTLDASLRIGSHGAGAAVVAQLNQKITSLKETNRTAWRCVALLSERLGEVDPAQAAVQEKVLAHHPGAAQAVSLAVAGDREKAVAALETQLAAQPSTLSEAERGVLDRERRRCLAELGRWGELSTACDAALPFDAAAMWDTDNRELLRHHVLSKSRLAEERADCAEVLHEFFRDAVDAPPRAEALASSGLLTPAAVVALVKNDHAAARGYVAKALFWTVKAWSGLVQPQRATKHEVSDLLTNLQSLVEVDEYLKLSHRAGQGRATAAEARRLMHRWSDRVAAFGGSAAQWGAYTHLRALLASLLVSSAAQMDGGASHEVVTVQDALYHHGKVVLRAAHVLHTDSQHFASRRFLHMFAAVQEQLEAASGAAHPTQALPPRVQELYLEFVELAVRNSIARTVVAATPDRARKLFTKTIQYIEEENGRHGLQTTRKTAYNLLCGAAHEGYARTTAALSAEAGVVEEAGKKALVHFRDAATSGGDAAQRARALEELAKFVDVLLSDARYQHAGVDRDSLSVLLVKSYLGALMTGASKTAQLRLPRALEVIQQSQAAKGAFTSLMKRVDSWLFLPWVNQIVSYLSSPAAADVAALLLTRLAKKFPQQVLCALSASSQELQALALGDAVARRHVETLLHTVRARIRGEVPLSAAGTAGGGLWSGPFVQPLAAGTRKPATASVGAAAPATRLELFIAALEKLHNPDLRFKGWLDDLQTLLREFRLDAASAGADAAARKKSFQHRLGMVWAGMCADVLTRDERHKAGALDAKFAEKAHSKEQGGFAVTVAAQVSQTASPSSPEGLKPSRRSAKNSASKAQPATATMRVSLSDDIEHVMKPIVRDIGVALDAAVWDAFQKRVKDWQAVVKAAWGYARNHGPAPLSLHSTWLAGYQCGGDEPGHEQMILMPQQPFGYLATATPSRLPDVASVAPSVLVMNSIQKPKKVVFHGTDEVEYPFLVKGGEDLRQDQRIQQMFQLFNSVMAQRASCTSRGLAVRGYSVVPLSPRVGLVEWVDHCAPMKSLIEGQLVNYPGVQAHHAAKKHHEFLLNVGKAGDWATGFKVLYGDHGKTDLRAKFEELAGEIDPFYLKKAMVALCATHAAFYDARSRFTSSYAAASVAQWLVGIGDRHLDNFLVDKRTCDIVPIDFGHAFGTATELLHIPELMPFRLTPQLCGVWAPLGATLLRGGMTAALTALQDSKHLILDVLSVFVREPLATWQRTALRKHRKGKVAKEDTPATATAPHDAYAAAKIKNVTQKLNLVNPWVPIAEDLAGNSIAAATTLKHPHGMAHARAILKGRPGRNVRADVPDTCRSTDEQVACLIDMASDPNILCRTYMGWAPLF